MPKAKSALFTGISGSLRKSVTFRDTTQTPDITMQTRPVPTDRRTAKQAAVRDAYARLAWLWKNLPTLDKTPYEAMAEARNLTPWNCWLSFHLPLMRLTPKFYTAFAEGSGTTIQDFSIGGQTGTANGPVFQEKNQFPNLYFDGVDDRVTFDRPGYYDTTSDFSIFIIETSGTSTSVYQGFLSTKLRYISGTGLLFFRSSTRALGLTIGNGTSGIPCTASLPNPPESFNVLGVIKNGTSVKFYSSGTWASASLPSSEVTKSPLPLILGNVNDLGGDYRGNLHIATLIPSAVPESVFTTLEAHYRPFFT